MKKMKCTCKCGNMVFSAKAMKKTKLKGSGDTPSF